MELAIHLFRNVWDAVLPGTLVSDPHRTVLITFAGDIFLPSLLYSGRALGGMLAYSGT